MFALRPYQQAARDAVLSEWQDGRNRTLLVLPTGCGKTIVFSSIAAECVRRGQRVLIMAHRGELLTQAAEKLKSATGLSSAIEKAEETSIGKWERIVVGSVQSMMRDTRLSRFPPNYFGSIIVDEAHHCLSDSYQHVLRHFSGANVLGVTATPDRSDMKDLGAYFNSLAYEYTLPAAIRDGYLAPIKAQMIPLKLDLSDVRTSAGDYQASDIDSAIDPYFEQIAQEMESVCRGRKTVVFLPLIRTSQKFQGILSRHGFRTAEVNGSSANRTEILRDFDSGKYDILCNSMLLTEGWDCPTVDTVVILRPTKSRALYSQMVGRGTRLAEGKEYLLLLDFLWLTQKHELCRPASLIASSDEVAEAMTKKLEAVGEAMDIEQAEKEAREDVVAQREKALAEELKKMRKRKKTLVDPLQFEMSIHAEDLANYVPCFASELKPPTEAQIRSLENAGLSSEGVDNSGKASELLRHLRIRKIQGLSTPKQIRFLEGRGFKDVGTWSFDEARKLIDRIAVNGWRIPQGIVPSDYKPAQEA